MPYFTGLTQSAPLWVVWRANALQEPFFLADVGRFCRPTSAKEGDSRGRLAAPKPPPRKSCYFTAMLFGRSDDHIEISRAIQSPPYQFAPRNWMLCIPDGIGIQ